jgi:hypothetical protein
LISVRLKSKKEILQDILKRFIIAGRMYREIQSSTDFLGLGLCSEVLNTRWKEVFVSKMIGADSMTGLMNLRSLKNFVLLQSVHWQGTEGPKNEMSLGLFELDF